MTARWHWRDADQAATRLTSRASERRLLLLLARLPFLPARVLAQLAGLHGGASLYRALQSFTAAGLVVAIRPPIRPGHSPRLHYLTDHGLATISIDQGVDVRHLARHNRLDDAGLLALLPGLPQLLALYDLLAAVAASRPGPPDLLAWERPWRRRYQRPTAKAAVSAVLPGYAAFAWDGEAGRYLLIPDLATFPLRLFRPALDHLLVLRGLQRCELPALMIATNDTGRAAAWKLPLEETCQRRAEAPLAAHVATWHDLRVGFTLPPARGTCSGPPETLIHRVQLRPGNPRRSSRRLPRLVGETLVAPITQPRGADWLGRVALGLTAADRELLDVVGRHPFLPLDWLAIVLGWSQSAARRRRNRLIDRGLMRLIQPNEVDPNTARLELAELTADGLELVAAQQGLSLSRAVRANGLTGGGSDQPIGPRHMLLTQFRHTHGGDGVFVSLIATARCLAVAGNDDALVEWRSAAACGRRRVRPDGYGLYRHWGRLYGFFLEYDRGTMSARDYRRKFAAYYNYWTSRQFEQDYDGFPTILIVTPTSRSEQRIADAARMMTIGRGTPLPILLTTIERVRNSRDDLLGRIWSEPQSGARRLWPTGP